MSRSYEGDVLPLVRNLTTPVAAPIPSMHATPLLAVPRPIAPEMASLGHVSTSHHLVSKLRTYEYDSLIRHRVRGMATASFTRQRPWRVCDCMHAYAPTSFHRVRELPMTVARAGTGRSFVVSCAL